VKDAIRCWLAEQQDSDTMVHPAAISIGQTESGQPFVEPIEGVDRLPKISLSHTDGCIVAVASSEAVGIDVEPASAETGRILEHFADQYESQLIRDLSADQPAEAWETRLWCAKESVSKAIGTGLGGQLSDFRLVAVEPNGRLRIHHQPSSRELIAATSRDDTMILALCLSG
jgi:phosphopantetheinyl transferase